MASKKQFNTRYSPEFKICVIMDMRKHGLSYHETVRKHWGVDSRQEIDLYRDTVKRWERIYLEEGEAGFYIERRGRQTKMNNPKKGRPRKKPLPSEVEEDLIAENQRLKDQLEYLQMENDYLKKLDALVRKEAQQKGKKRR